LPEQPDAIPYVTSYYQRRWGFCLTHREREQLQPGNYRVVIDSELKDGSLTYGQWLLPGDSPQEVLLSTYLCHPSMANNELSGPVVTTYLARWLQTLPHRKYTYRALFIPETIGSIAYLSRHYQALQQAVVAGFVVTCVGDDRAYSYLPSRHGDTLADRVARHVLRLTQPDFVSYRYLDRGSDERQYCSPGIDLPVCSVMRTKYGCYPEYHTSLDDLNLVTPAGLWGGFQALQRALQCLELNECLGTTVLCEPQLGKRGLYPTTSTKSSGAQIRDMMNFLAYCDGRTSSLEIADLIGVPLWELQETIGKLKREGILVRKD
jgi:aminopeptidase-like protein